MRPPSPTQAPVHRTMDAARLNVVANDPSVLPSLGFGGDAPLDLSEIVENPANVAIVGEHGGFIAVNQGAGQYEVHSLFLPEGRGGAAAALALVAFRYMFTATDAQRIVTKVPESNRAAASLARHVGFRPAFERQGAWVDGGAVSYQALGFARWLARDPVVQAEGEWFHDQLSAAKSAAGSEQPEHDDDPAHDRAVGAAVLMLKAGNPFKAALTYNQWAAFAGYAPLTILSQSPLLLDVVDAIVEVRGHTMEILKCR